MALPRTPRPEEVVIHVHTPKGQVGPFSRRTLKAELDAGNVRAKDHVWFEGMEGWAVLGEHAELLEGLDAPAGAVPRAPGESDDDHNDRIFGNLVKASWDYLYEHQFASHIDEVFLGAIITSTLDTGYSLIDITSDGTNHYLRFENLEDKSRIIVRLHHLTGSLAVSRVLGQRASVVVGYGERVGNITKVMGAVQAEMKSSYIRNPEPGTVTVDGDLGSGYVYVQVDMYWNIEDYVKPDYTVEYGVLSAHMNACVHALRKYLRGRFA